MQNLRKFLPAALAVLLVTGMTAAAELLQNKEILFPEIAAIAAGALLPQKLAWQTDARRIFAFITVGAFLGVGIVRFVPLALAPQLCLAFLVASLLYLYSRTGFAPMISAVVLPVMLGTRSLVYPAAAITLTALILAARALLVQLGLREKISYAPLPLPDAHALLELLVRWLIGCGMIVIAVRRGAAFAAAPPLLVAYTEFWHRDHPAQKTPFLFVSWIAVCAGIGTLFRAAGIQLGLPLFVSAGLTMLCVAALMLWRQRFIPPAAALSILIFLLPDETVPPYLLGILTGASLLTGAAVLQGRIRELVKT